MFEGLEEKDDQLNELITKVFIEQPWLHLGMLKNCDNHMLVFSEHLLIPM